MCRKDRVVLIGVACIGLLVCAGLSGSLGQTEGKPKDPQERQHNYYFAIYRPGPGWVKEKTMFEQPKIREHGLYMGQLQMKGEIVLGGAFTDHTGGLVIFDFADTETAVERIKKDPIVMNEIVLVEIIPAAKVEKEEGATKEEKKRHNYIVAIYRPGPMWVKGKCIYEQPKIMEHANHVENLDADLAFVGLLKNDKGDIIGGFGIFDFEDIEDLRILLKKDPMVQSKIVDLKIHPLFPIIPGPLDTDGLKNPKFNKVTDHGS